MFDRDEENSIFGVFVGGLGDLGCGYYGYQEDRGCGLVVVVILFFLGINGDFGFLVLS